MNCFIKYWLLPLWVTMMSLSAYGGTERTHRIYDPAAVVLQDIEIEGETYTSVRRHDFYETTAEGEMNLPVEYIRFLVPVYTNRFSVTLKNVETTDVQKLQHPVVPVQPPQSVNFSEPREPARPSQAAYSAGAAIRAEVVDDGFIDGCNHIVTVAIYPVECSANGTRLRFAQALDVELAYEACSEEELRDTPIFPPRPSTQIDLSSIVVNYDSSCAPQNSPNRSWDESKKEYYYIICPQNLVEAFDDLARWKRQKGYEVVVKPIEDVYKEYPNTSELDYPYLSRWQTGIFDEASSLRKYLMHEFFWHGSFYCLLAGDWRTNMPIRYVTANSKPDTIAEIAEYQSQPYSTNFIPTDTYFSDLTTTWNLNNTVWNEKYYTVCYSYLELYHYDIPVGRLHCATPQEVKNYVDKLILYESNPGRGNTDYLDNATYFAQCSWVNYTPNYGDSYWYPTNCLVKESVGVYEYDNIFRNKKNVHRRCTFAAACAHYGSPTHRHISLCGINSI